MTPCSLIDGTNVSETPTASICMKDNKFAQLTYPENDGSTLQKTLVRINQITLPTIQEHRYVITHENPRTQITLRFDDGLL
jgi:hypothetical protein